MTDEDKGWILDELVDHPGIRAAIVASGDGMLVVRDTDIGRDNAERWAAAAAVLQSLARNGMEPAGFPPTGFRRTVIEHDLGYQLAQSVAVGAYLVVSTDLDADLGVVTMRMQDVAQRLGRELASPARAAVAVRSTPGHT